MFKWLSRLFRRVKRVQLPGGFGVELNEPKETEAPVRFVGFTPWANALGVIRGAGSDRIKLHRLQAVSNADWAVLKHLGSTWVERGEKAHTFGYKSAELSAQYQDPLAR